jgi:hypothetical protein
VNSRALIRPSAPPVPSGHRTPDNWYRRHPLLADGPASVNSEAKPQHGSTTARLGNVPGATLVQPRCRLNSRRTTRTGRTSPTQRRERDVLARVRPVAQEFPQGRVISGDESGSAAQMADGSPRDPHRSRADPHPPGRIESYISAITGLLSPHHRPWMPTRRELRPRGNAAPPSAHIAGEEHSPNSWVAKVLTSGTGVETGAGSLLARADVLTPRRSTSPGGEHGCAGHGLIPEAQRGTVIPADRGPRCRRLRWYFVSIEITMARRSSSRVLHRRVSRMFFFGEVKKDVAKLTRVGLGTVRTSRRGRSPTGQVPTNPWAASIEPIVRC